MFFFFDTMRTRRCNRQFIINVWISCKFRSSQEHWWQRASIDMVAKTINWNFNKTLKEKKQRNGMMKNTHTEWCVIAHLTSLTYTLYTSKIKHTRHTMIYSHCRKFFTFLNWRLLMSEKKNNNTKKKKNTKQNKIHGVAKRMRCTFEWFQLRWRRRHFDKSTSAAFQHIMGYVSGVCFCVCSKTFSIFQKFDIFLRISDQKWEIIFRTFHKPKSKLFRLHNS